MQLHLSNDTSGSFLTYYKNKRKGAQQCFVGPFIPKQFGRNY